MAGIRQSTKDILVVLGEDLAIASYEVSDKPSEHLGRKLEKTAFGCRFGIGQEYIDEILAEYNTSCRLSWGLFVTRRPQSKLTGCSN